MAVDDAVLAQFRQLGKAIRLSVKSVASDLSTDEILSVSTLFDEWKVGANYATGDIIRYKNNLYQVLQTVTGAQAEHTPDVAVSLYKQIGEPDESGIFPWVQPLGATDAYAKGAVVTHNGKTWVSDIANNVWEPGVYGWTEKKD